MQAHGMRTTLAIDDDVLLAAKAIAEQKNRPLGEIISDLARRSLHSPQRAGAERNGIPLLRQKKGMPPVTLAVVNALRDEVP